MINLLPPTYQKEIRQEENRKLISILGMLFLLFLISLVLILFSVKIYIQGQMASVKVFVDLGENNLKTTEIQSLEQKINSTNKNISKLSVFYSNQNDTIGILEKIFNILPPEIKMTSFSWQKNTGQISISGFSPTREALFSLQKKLEGENQFIDKSTIVFPSQNWIKSSDINFDVSFNLVNQGSSK